MVGSSVAGLGLILVCCVYFALFALFALFVSIPWRSLSSLLSITWWPGELLTAGTAVRGVCGCCCCCCAAAAAVVVLLLLLLLLLQGDCGTIDSIRHGHDQACCCCCVYWWCSGALAELDVIPGNEF